MRCPYKRVKFRENIKDFFPQSFLCSHRKNNVVKLDRNGIAIVATRFVENTHTALATVFCIDTSLRTALSDTFMGKNIGFPS